MAVKGGPNIVTQGLNLALDSGNKKSIPLDPTVNQYLNPQFLNNTASWQFASWSDLIYTYQTVNAPGPDGITIPMLKITRISGSIGSAHFHQGNNGKYYSGSAFTMTAYVSGSGTFQGRHQNLGVLGTYTLSNNWQRVAYTFTQPNNTNYPYWAADQITFSESLYFVYAQSENVPYASPYVSGSRTNWNNTAQINTTASLSSGSVTASIPQFQSLGSGLLNFDGIGSFANTGVDLRWGTGSSVSLEMWIKNGVASTAAPFIGTTNFMWQLRQGNQQSPGSNLTYVYWDTTGNHTNGPVMLVNNFFDGAWKHLILTWDSGSSTTSIYKNGFLQTAQTSSNPAANRSIADTVKLGGNIYSWASGTYWSGSIANVKFYNRALTADEVSQNYNALKTRFGL